MYVQLEPFFVTLSLYDVAEGRKISADLHVDLNHPLVSCCYGRRLAGSLSDSAERQHFCLQEVLCCILAG